jgi:uncharacterized protein
MSSPAYETAVRLLREEHPTPDASGDLRARAADLRAAAGELREAFVRSEHLIGLLPADAPDVMVEAFRRAGELGDARAWLELGRLYRAGAAPWAPYPATDPRAAVDAYRRAEAAGSPEAALEWVQTAYFARDETLAPEATARLAELQRETPEDAGMLLLVGYFLHQGYGYARDEPAGIAFFEAAAVRGDAAAAFELSVVHATGAGVPADADAALQWTFRAAELGSDRAQANLGGMYATGNGVPEDAATAVEWYARSADSGNARGALVAGIMLLRGDDGLPVDAVRAAALFDRADELGADVDDMLAGMGLERP